MAKSGDKLRAIYKCEGDGQIVMIREYARISTVPDDASEYTAMTAVIFWELEDGDEAEKGKKPNTFSILTQGGRIVKVLECRSA